MKYHTPTLPAEALATGKCVLMSKALHEKEPYNKLKDGKEVLTIDPNNTEKIREILERLIKNPEMTNTVGNNGYRAIKNYAQFNEYLDKTITLYKSILQNE